MRALVTRLFTLALIVIACGSRAEDGSFDSKGVKIIFRIQGQGEPVVLIHGFTGNLESWTPLASELSKSHYVVSLDCRGHGKSGKPALHSVTDLGCEHRTFNIQLSTSNQPGG